MDIPDIKHLEFIYNRLVNLYGENPNVDYLRRLNWIIDNEYNRIEEFIRDIKIR